MAASFLCLQEDLGAGMRLLDLEQLQMETHTIAQALTEKENDKTALQAARRQSVQVPPCCTLPSLPAAAAASGIARHATVLHA